ncbi:MAG: exodeoxyribonuclease VII small subunit [Gemmataceae bacterium]
MTNSSPDKLSLEESLAELEHVVRDLEDGQIGLEESLTRYEFGVGLIKRCQAQLRQAEQRIQLLTGVNEDGQPVLQPFPASSVDVSLGDGKRVKKRPNDCDEPF